MTMLPPEDRPPLAARIDAAMEEVSIDQAEQALIYGGGLGVLAWVMIGVHLTSGIGFLVGFLTGALYFLVATRGRVPVRMRPYFVAASLPLAISVIWLS